jgi:hypothetical protein
MRIFSILLFLALICGCTDPPKIPTVGSPGESGKDGSNGKDGQGKDGADGKNGAVSYSCFVGTIDGTGHAVISSSMFSTTDTPLIQAYFYKSGWTAIDNGFSLTDGQLSLYTGSKGSSWYNIPYKVVVIR